MELPIYPRKGTAPTNRFRVLENGGMVVAPILEVEKGERFSLNNDEFAVCLIRPSFWVGWEATTGKRGKANPTDGCGFFC